VSHCRRTLRGEGHSAADWGIGGSVWLQTAGSKVCSFGQWAAATFAAPLVSLLVSTPLRIVNCCWAGLPCMWRYINVETFNLYPLTVCKRSLIIVILSYCIQLWALSPDLRYRLGLGACHDPPLSQQILDLPLIQESRLILYL